MKIFERYNLSPDETTLKMKLDAVGRYMKTQNINRQQHLPAHY